MTTPAGSTEGFAVAVVREDGAWQVSLLADELLDDLDGVISAVRQVSGAGAAFAMLAVDDEFFVIVRPVPGGASLLLSDATAALDYDIAADVLDLLQVPVPDDDDLDEDPWPEGDLAVLADFGIPEEQMQLVCSEDDLYPDEQLQTIAEAAGFETEFVAVVDPADRD
ncbi:tRNA adenosine deaminase-associated protein [Nakamurella aerolata]|uniref:tRNA adenosine deaminase-associated protein n=1 Tax=Nakamurella aerolata TaxID=1656892 RepID=A0A849AAP8_9ACTN|nr:tRNA adenosine deaminase-associated protein [Nakamurella aerolata]